MTSEKWPITIGITVRTESESVSELNRNYQLYVPTVVTCPGQLSYSDLKFSSTTTLDWRRSNPMNLEIYLSSWKTEYKEEVLSFRANFPLASSTVILTILLSKMQLWTGALALLKSHFNKVEIYPAMNQKKKREYVRIINFNILQIIELTIIGAGFSSVCMDN